MPVGRCVTGAAGVVSLLALLLMAGCGDGGGGDDAGVREAAEAREAAAVADTAAPADPAIIERGFVSNHAEAGFRVYWPGGCGRIKEQVSDGATRRAHREFIYTCLRDGDNGRAVSVRVLHDAQDAGGAPPSPPFVVALVAEQVTRYKLRIRNQRPLEAGGIQGVEVQAVEPGGAGELWMRGLLVGVDVYLLMAWSEAGGLFDDPEIADFFASFRLGNQ
jgi:hypothetical protein